MQNQIGGRHLGSKSATWQSSASSWEAEKFLANSQDLASNIWRGARWQHITYMLYRLAWTESCVQKVYKTEQKDANKNLTLSLTPFANTRRKKTNIACTVGVFLSGLSVGLPSPCPQVAESLLRWYKIYSNWTCERPKVTGAQRTLRSVNGDLLITLFQDKTRLVDISSLQWYQSKNHRMSGLKKRFCPWSITALETEKYLLKKWRRNVLLLVWHPSKTRCNMNSMK